MDDNYLEYRFTVVPQQPGSEILIAELGALGFESFLELGDGIKAYIRKREWHADLLEEVVVLRNPDFKISFDYSEIEQVNWNEAWEKNFSPIQLGHHCMVRAPFHEKNEVTYDIVIMPKMSFGTGHHETTHMMLQFLLKNRLSGLTVLDMGCGTGVLAILAAMRGARKVDAIDNDHWSYLNTLENVSRNNQLVIRVEQGDAALLPGRSYDLVLANINRNTLLQDIPSYASTLNPGGTLILSGFLKADLPSISERCAESGLRFQENLQNNDWVSAKYVF